MGYVQSKKQLEKIKKARGNFKHSEETKSKISESHKKEKHPLFGKHHSEESKLKMSIAKLGITPWNKGLGTKTSTQKKIRSSKEYKLWRNAVFERDNYTCIWCGQRGGKLNADHIKPFCLFPELRLAIDNGRTLCEDCHKTTETYGNKNKSNY